MTTYADIYRRMHARRHGNLDRFQREWDVWLLRRVPVRRAVKGKKWVRPSNARMMELIGPTATAEFDRRSDGIDRLFARRQARRDNLAALALEVPEAELVAGDTWHRLHVCDSHATQGMGSRAYTRAEGVRWAEPFLVRGIPVELAWQPVPADVARACYARPWGAPSPSLHVNVRCEPWVASCVTQKPGDSLEDYVRKAWARGINPRVALPFLPHGFEESHGLDFFGGKRGEAGKPAAPDVPEGMGTTPGEVWDREQRIRILVEPPLAAALAEPSGWLMPHNWQPVTSLDGNVVGYVAYATGQDAGWRYASTEKPTDRHSEIGIRAVEATINGAMAWVSPFYIPCGAGVCHQAANLVRQAVVTGRMER